MAAPGPRYGRSWPHVWPHMQAIARVHWGECRLGKPKVMMWTAVRIGRDPTGRPPARA
jgi:hypothetical protein